MVNPQSACHIYRCARHAMPMMKWLVYHNSIFQDDTLFQINRSLLYTLPKTIGHVVKTKGLRSSSPLNFLQNMCIRLGIFGAFVIDVFIFHAYATKFNFIIGSVIPAESGTDEREGPWG